MRQQRTWHVRRAGVPTATGQQRWDRAYQLLLQWAMNPPGSRNSCQQPRSARSTGRRGYLRRERDQNDRRNVFVVRTSNGAEFLEGFKSNLRESDGAAAAHRPIIGAAYAHHS